MEAALAARGEPPPGARSEVPNLALPGPVRRPAAVLCLLFDEVTGQATSDDPAPGADPVWGGATGSQAHVILTRRSSRLRSHTHQVSFPGGRIEPGEDAAAAALREAGEEIGIDPASVRLIGRLSSMRTVVNPSPITPFVGVSPSRPELIPNPAEVERAFAVPLVELLQPEVYRQELWTFPDGSEVAMSFFELVGDTVWGATARMLTELLDVVTHHLQP